jgi:hypothetical protein
MRHIIATATETSGQEETKPVGDSTLGILGLVAGVALLYFGSRVRSRRGLRRPPPPKSGGGGGA